MAIEPILNTVVKTLEEQRERKYLGVISKLEFFATKHIAQHEDVIQKLLRKDFGDIIDDTTANRVLGHIAKGHLSVTKELLWADLMQQRKNPDETYQTASKIFSAILVHLIYAQSKPDGVYSDSDTLDEASQKDMEELLPRALISVKRRIICSNCYRVIREGESNEMNMHYGPSLIQCATCGHITPTHLLPPNKLTYTFPPIFLIVVGVFMLVIFRDSVCGIGGWVSIFIGILLAFQLWQQRKEPNKPPIW